MDRKRKIGFCILVGLCFCLLCSCKTQKKFTESVTQKMSVKEAFLKAKASEEDFRGLELNFSAKIASPLMNQSFSGQMKFIKDSAILISAGKFGLEAFRALLTQDSVFLINRMGKTYTAADYSLLKNFMGENMGFQDLQSLLLGRISEFGQAADKVLEDSVLHLVSQKAFLRMSAQWSLKTEKTTSYQVESGDVFFLKADYVGRLETIKACPKEIRLYIEKPIVSSLVINYGKGKINNDLECRFNIPDKYSKTE